MTAGGENDRLSPESLLEPSGQRLVLVLTDFHSLTIWQEHCSMNLVSIILQSAYFRVGLRKDHLNPAFLDNSVEALQISRAGSWRELVGSVDPSVEFDTRLVYISSGEENVLAIFADPQAPTNIVARATPSSSD